MDEASAAKLEELHLGAVSEGEDWLRRALLEMTTGELRVLAAAGGVETHSNLVAGSRAAQIVGESLGAPDGGWVRAKME